MSNDYTAQFLVGVSTSVTTAVFNLAISGQVNWIWTIFAFLVPFYVLQFYQLSGFSPFKEWHVKDTELTAQIGQPTGSGAWELDTNQPVEWAIYGPYKPLKKGRYRAIFRLKVNNNSTDDIIAEIDVSSRTGGKRLSLRTLTIQDFQQSDIYQDFPLDFFLLNDDNNIEFRVCTKGVNRRLTLEYVKLSRRL